MKAGDYVVYKPTGERGRIKSFNVWNGNPFVVYKCNDDWENYTHYTGCSTEIEDLLKEEQV